MDSTSPPIRVALIGSRYDMGSVTALWRLPKTYARFLGQELAFVYKGRLLVVMPNGYGTSLDGKATPAAQAVVDRLAPPARPAASADAAVRAVVALAAKEGVVVQPPAPVASQGSNPGTTPVVASNPLAFKGPLGWGWVAVGVVLAGLVAAGLKRFPDEVLKTDGPACNLEDGA